MGTFLHPARQPHRLPQSISPQRTLAKGLIAHRWLWQPLFAFGLSRLVILLVIYLAAVPIPDNPLVAGYHLRADALWLDALGSRWDSGFYLNIAQEGYHYFGPGVEFPSVAFFPLLPLLMKGIAPLFGGDLLVSGIVISNLALLLSAILLYRLVTQEFDEPTAGRSVWYLLIFPTAFFGSAIYSESLFLLAAIGAFYSARRNAWAWALLCGLLGTATRFVGITLLPTLLLLWWQQRRHPDPALRAPRWAWVTPMGAALGLLGYMAFLGWRFGDPLAFVHASAVWQRSPQPLWEMVQSLFVPPAGGWATALPVAAFDLNPWIDALFSAAALLVALFVLAQRRWAEALFVLSGLLIPLNSGLWASQRRYVWVLFPLFILLARWGKSLPFDRVINALFLTLLAYFTLLYANWYWVA
ncbi:MAG: hypothetical protein KDD73_08370 [Anaerolineales bacterium]|nr:hypothetical protein [Anaerolineales bacterium]MCB9171479.1 hypothetical protein [Ardenticatenales bacterium]